MRALARPASPAALASPWLSERRARAVPWLSSTHVPGMAFARLQNSHRHVAREHTHVYTSGCGIVEMGTNICATAMACVHDVVALAGLNTASSTSSLLMRSMTCWPLKCCWSASSSCRCSSNHSASSGCFPLASCVVALPSLVQSSLEKTALDARVKRRHKLLHNNDPRCHGECEQGLLHELTDPPQVDLRLCRLTVVSFCAKTNGNFHSLQLENDEFLRLVLRQ